VEVCDDKTSTGLVWWRIEGQLGLAMYPRTPLGDSLDFDGDRMKAQIEQGYADAQTFLGP